MRSLEYRAPRVEAHFGIDFVAGTDLFRGVCVDVSEQGARASFHQVVPMGKVGSLILHHPQCRMTIPARVVYLAKDQVGFAFFEHTSRDRELLLRLMNALGINGTLVH